MNIYDFIHFLHPSYAIIGKKEIKIKSFKNLNV